MRYWCVRVPRHVESKITQWVRFQHSEELADEQVRLRYLDRGERREVATQIQKKGRNVSKERDDYVKSSSYYSDNDDQHSFLILEPEG